MLRPLFRSVFSQTSLPISIQNGPEFSMWNACVERILLEDWSVQLGENKSDQTHIHLAGMLCHIKLLKFLVQADNSSYGNA